MSRQLAITAIVPTGAGPGTITIGPISPDNILGDWTSVFTGKFYRQTASPYATAPFYSAASAPVGYQLIEATQFEIVQNASYAGRYTVYTPTSARDFPSSTYASSSTAIAVNEVLRAPVSPADLSTGYVTNVSTYYIYVAGGSPIVIPPGVTSTDYPIGLPGRTTSGWGEVFNQDLFALYQNFASTTAPANPSIGALWYNPSTNVLSVFNGTWVVANSGVYAAANSYKHTQSSGSATWTINHNLRAAAPFLAHASFFVDTTGLGVYKPIIPADVTYVSANQLTVTFTAAYSGYALIRL
jgi:hypothetical protein